MLLKKFCFPESHYYFNRHTNRLGYWANDDVINRLPDISIKVQTEDETGEPFEYAATVKFVGIYRETVYYVDTATDRRKVQTTHYKNTYSYILGGNGNFKRFVRNAPIVW